MNGRLTFALTAFALLLATSANAATCTIFHDRCVGSTKTHVVGTLPPNQEPPDQPAGVTVQGVGSVDKCDAAFKMCMANGEWVGPVSGRVHKNVDKQ